VGDFERVPAPDRFAELAGPVHETRPTLALVFGFKKVADVTSAVPRVHAAKRERKRYRTNPEEMRISRPTAVVEVDNAAGEAALTQQFQLHAAAVGESPVGAAHDDGRDEQMVLVEQPGLHHLAGEVGPAHRDVASRRRFHLPNRFGVEVPFDPRPGAGHLRERLGEHDLVDPLPYPSEVLNERPLIGDSYIRRP
jgi:hypothetical protein